MSAGTFVLGQSPARRRGLARDEERLAAAVADRVCAGLGGTANVVAFQIPASISARHIHVSRAVLDATFGAGYELRPVKDLSQPGQYAAQEALTVIGPRGREIPGVRILGPCRSYTQVELAPTDARHLQLPRPLVIRESGQLDGAQEVTLVGPAGRVTVAAAIRPTRHIHMSPAQARDKGVEPNQRVRIRIGGEAGTVFDHVLVRVNGKYHLDLHLDTDDANAAGLVGGEFVDVLRG